MRIYKKPIRLILKHTNTTIDDLIVWFKEWDVIKHGEKPCGKGHKYYRFSFYEGKFNCSQHCLSVIYIGYRICPGMYMWDFVYRYVDDRKFREEFLSELERMREEFE